jgi:hypothetical protein
MKRLLLAFVLVAGVLAPAAAAGGWATVQLSAVPTDGMKAGSDLPIDITVLQHGQTPLDGVTPVFRIRGGSGDLISQYRGEPTGKPGVYHVTVSFPKAGTYAYEVYDGFEQYGGAQVHTYPTVTIEAPDGGSSPYLPIVIGGALVLGLGIAVFAFARRGRPGRALPEAASLR